MEILESFDLPKELKDYHYDLMQLRQLEGLLKIVLEHISNMKKRGLSCDMWFCDGYKQKENFKICVHRHTFNEKSTKCIARHKKIVLGEKMILTDSTEHEREEEYTRFCDEKLIYELCAELEMACIFLKGNKDADNLAKYCKKYMKSIIGDLQEKFEKFKEIDNSKENL